MTGATTAKIRVVAVVIERDGRLLLCQRPDGKRHGGLWEFPGGKLLAGESALCAARRELAEELGVDVVALGPCLLAVSDVGSPYVIEFHRGTIAGDPAPLEHTAIAWAAADELSGYALAPSDRAFVKSWDEIGRDAGI